MLEVLTYISIGQLVMLIMLVLRQERSGFRKAAFLLFVWLLTVGIVSTSLNHFLWVPLLFGLPVVRMFVLHFFQKEVTNKNYFQLLIPLGLLPFVWLEFFGAKWIVLTYLLIEAIVLWFTFRREKNYRGISLKSIPARVAWVLFVVGFSILLVFAGFVDALWQVPPFDLLFVVSLLSMASGIAWFLTQADAFGVLKAPQKYASSSLDQQEKFRILQLLEEQVTEDYLLQPKASLADLARKLHTTPHQLSQVLNESKEMSFFDLLALQRVRAAKKLLRNEAYKGLTIEQIGEQVGYMSKSSFNTVFKKITGFTPSEYRAGNVRDHHVERPQHAIKADSSVRIGIFETFKNAGIMYTNFFKIYFRRLLRTRTFSLINILGLVVGTASAIFIWIYLQDELSYDQFHKDAGNIYRIAALTDNPQTRTPHPMAQAMVRDFPEVMEAVSFSPLYGPGLSKQDIILGNPERDVIFQEPDGYAVDTTFFKVFDFELTVGNEQEALKQVGGLIISEQLAKKLFPDENPLGKVLQYGTEKHPMIVSGVMKDVPEASHFHPNFMISYVTLKHFYPSNPWMQWEDYGHFNYVKLVSGADAKVLEQKIPEWLHNSGHMSDEFYESFASGTNRFGLQPLTDIHLTSHIRWELEANGNVIYIYILMAAIAFILVIVAINFINLTTARAFERAREIGVRRSLGADRYVLSGNFILENVFTCLIALVLAFGLCTLLLPNYNQLTDKSFAFATLFTSEVILFALAFALLIGFVSGLFPAFTALGIKVTEILKGKLGSTQKGVNLRKALVAVQFSVSAVLIFGSIVLVMQVNYLMSRPLGYNDQLLAVNLKSDAVNDRVEALKSEIRNVKGVKAVGAVSNLPGGQFNQNALYSLRNPDLDVDVSQIAGDFQVNEPLGLELVAGDWFEKPSEDDSLMSFVINETAVAELGLKHPVGEKVYWDDDHQYGPGRIIGVVKDFHFQSLHVPIQPLLITCSYDDLSYMLVSLSGDNWQEATKQIEIIYSSFDNEFGFEAFFLDQKNQQLYEGEQRSLRIFNVFAGIALGLAGIGLLGLAYLIIIQRTKEIGIRKILGATVSGLVMKENFTFLKLILIGLVVGLPAAYLIMQEWLAGFAYRVDVGFGAYLVTIAAISLIAILSVTIAVLRTVLANPSEALRYE